MVTTMTTSLPWAPPHMETPHMETPHMGTPCT